MKFSLSDLTLRDMTPDEMKHTYETDMQYVFPKAELKPCESIYREMLENKFLACGLYAGDELMGYAFTACIPGREQLFGQYVVVKEAYRSMGIGGVLMDKVCEHYAKYRCYFVEVEDPAFAKDEADLANRERRIRFYLRHNFRHTSIRSRVYGVDYEILVRPISQEVDDGEVREAVDAIYESMAMAVPGSYPAMFQVRTDA